MLTYREAKGFFKAVEAKSLSNQRLFSGTITLSTSLNPEEARSEIVLDESIKIRGRSTASSKTGGICATSCTTRSVGLVLDGDETDENAVVV